MYTEEILETIDQEIRLLQRARALLLGTNENAKPGRSRGRPKGSVNKTAKSLSASPIKTGRTLSAEGKARIAAGQRARWAAQKKAETQAKPAVKKTPVKGGKKLPAPAKAVTENEAVVAEA